MFGACLLTLPVWGEEPPDPIDREVTTSLKHDPSPRGQIRAFQHAQESWETEMAAIFGRLCKKLPPDQRTLLERSQSDWAAYFAPTPVHRSTQSLTVLFHSLEFCGLSTQWPSSGKYSISEGTFRRCSVVKSSKPCATSSR